MYESFVNTMLVYYVLIYYTLVLAKTRKCNAYCIDCKVVQSHKTISEFGFDTF